MTSIGKRIRNLRTERGLSQGDVSRSTGMGREYISRVEQGHVVPSVESVQRFAAALGVPVHELFREAPLEGGTDGWRNEEDSFVSALSSYVKKMDRPRLRMLMSLAERLVKKDRK